VTYTGVSGLDIRSPNGFEVCCQDTLCWNDALGVPSIISNKTDLTITLNVDSSCAEKKLIGLRYSNEILSLWRNGETAYRHSRYMIFIMSYFMSPNHI